MRREKKRFEVKDVGNAEESAVASFPQLEFAVVCRIVLIENLEQLP